MSFKGLQAFIVSMLAIAGCGASRTDVAWPEPCPLGRDITAYRPPRGTFVASELFEIEEPTGAVTLPKALSLALMQSPGIAAVSWDVRAAEARQVQAGLRPNPELEFEVEEFGGSGMLAGFGAAASSLTLSQELELGGKRAKRKGAARLDRRVAAWDYEAKRIDVLTATTVAFIEVLAAQERLALARDAVRLAEETLSAISEKVDAGKVPPLQKMQAEVQLSRGRLDLARAERNLRRAREALAAAWGSSKPRFERADGDLYGIGSVPPLEGLLERVDRNPFVARSRTKVKAALARVELERANARPNLNVGAGVRRFEESGDAALAFGLSIPLPVYDRNKGGIAEAMHEVEKARAGRQGAELSIRTALRRAYGELMSAHDEALSLRDEVLPTVRRAFESAREGYRQGKFGYLEVLDTQRTLVEVRGQYIDAVAACHEAVAEAEWLVAAKLGDIGSGRKDRPQEE